MFKSWCCCSHHVIGVGVRRWEEGQPFLLNYYHYYSCRRRMSRLTYSKRHYLKDVALAALRFMVTITLLLLAIIVLLLVTRLLRFWRCARWVHSYRVSYYDVPSVGYHHFAPNNCCELLPSSVSGARDLEVCSNCQAHCSGCEWCGYTAVCVWWVLIVLWVVCVSVAIPTSLGVFVTFCSSLSFFKKTSVASRCASSPSTVWYPAFCWQYVY